MPVDINVTPMTGQLMKSVRGQHKVDMHGVVRKLDGAVGIAFQYSNVQQCFPSRWTVRASQPARREV